MPSRLRVFSWILCACTPLVFALTSQASTEFFVPPGADAHPFGIAKGPDGNEWVTEPGRGGIAKITPSGQTNEYFVKGAQHLNHIVSPGDGNLWFTDDYASFIGSINASTGAINTYTANFTYTYGNQTYSYFAYPNDITLGPDGALWFSGDYAAIVGRFDLSTHKVTQLNLTSSICPYRIVTGSDKNLWFIDQCAATGHIVRLTTAGVATSFGITGASYLNDIVAGPDGNLWVTSYATQAIFKVTTTGTVTKYTLVNGSSYGAPYDITVGADGKLWFKEYFYNPSPYFYGPAIGIISTAGAVTQGVSALEDTTLDPYTGIAPGADNLSIWTADSYTNTVHKITIATQKIANTFNSTVGSHPTSITLGPDGNVWFIESMANKIGTLKPDGTVAAFTIPTANSQPQQITNGPDGNLWFTELGPSGSLGQQKIGRITPAGAITEFPITADSPCNYDGPYGITSAGGKLWVADSCGQVEKFTTAGVETDITLPFHTPDVGAGCGPQSITTGSDGNLWYLDYCGNPNVGDGIVGRITTAGTVTTFSFPSYSIAGFSGGAQITSGSDGNLWIIGAFNHFNGNYKQALAKVTTSGVISFVDPDPSSVFGFYSYQPTFISASDGNLWTADADSSLSSFNTQGLLQDQTCAPNSIYIYSESCNDNNRGLAVGSDGRLYATDYTTGQISRFSAISGLVTLNPPSGLSGTTINFLADFNDGTPTAQASDLSAKVLIQQTSNNYTVNQLTVPVINTGSQKFSAIIPAQTFNQAGNYQVSLVLHDSVDNHDYVTLAKTTIGIPTSTSISATPNPAAQGFPITVTAHVTSNNGIPVGTVAFNDYYSGTLGTAQVDQNGYATLTTSVLTVGQHYFYANYSGNTDFISSNSQNTFYEYILAAQGDLFGSNALLQAYCPTCQPNVATPYALASGDFNGDGFPDVVVAEDTQQYFQVFLGYDVSAGGATYNSPSGYGYGTGEMQSIAVADFNHDGKLDVVATNRLNDAGTSGTDGVTVFLGDGTGYFPVSNTYLSGAANANLGTRPISVAVGDFNRDGNPDLAVANRDDNTVSIMLGNGDGTFQNAVNYSVAAGPVKLAVADMNGDGKLDVYVVDATNNAVSVLFGNGDGTFNSVGTIGTAGPGQVGNNPVGITIADLNGDGKLDLAVVNKADDTVSVALASSGDGLNFTWQQYSTGPTGSAPTSVIAVDINRDGVPDLAITNSGTNTLAILIGNGDGTFRAPNEYATDPGPQDVVAIDANRDGVPDLVTANLTAPDPAGCTTTCSIPGDFSVFIGIGPGPESPNYSISNLGAGQTPFAVATGDFNRDGKQDIAAADTNFNSVSTCQPGGTSPCDDVSIILNGGTSAGATSFATDVDYAVGTFTRDVKFGDLNGDGKLDIVAISGTKAGVGGTNQVEVLLGNGDGTYQPAVAYPAGGNDIRYSVLGDFNGDGKLDVAVTDNGSDSVSVLLGNGDGTLQTAVTSLGGISPFQLAAADLNDDGKLDLVVTNPLSNSVSVLFGNGDGTFQPALPYPVGTTPVAVTIGDFNRDGILDIATANQGTNDVSILLGIRDTNYPYGPTGTFQAALNYAAGNLPFDIKTVDYNRDGIPDLIIASNADNAVTLLTGNGDGSFQAPMNILLGAGVSGPSGIAFADLNGDGVPDFVTGNQGSNNVSALLSGKKTLTSTGVGTCGTPAGSLLADFNNDNNTDLAVITTTCGAITSGAVTIQLGNGDGTFQTALSPANPVGNNPSAIAFGDFNKDGKRDLAITNKDDNTVSVLIGKGDGTFFPAATYGLNGGTAPISLFVTDINADGNADIAVVNQGTKNVTILQGKGDGTFTSLAPFSIHAQAGVFASAINLLNPNAMVMGDLSGDGKPDMVISDSNANTVTVLLNNGTGQFTNITPYAVGTGPDALVLGDFNGDGALDIAAANFTSNTISVLLNDKTGKFSAAQSFATGRGPSALAVLDYDNDKKLDLAVTNATDNTVMVMLGNGDGTFKSGTVVGAASGPTAVTVGSLTGGGSNDIVVTNGSNIGVLLNNADVTMAPSQTANSTYGQMASLGASVHAVVGSRIPSGSITFQEGSNVIGSAPLNTSGIAKLDTRNLSAGSHTITATYSGSSLFNSNNVQLSQTVLKATPGLTLTSSLPNASRGEAVTYTATMAVLFGTPSGSVSFTIDGTPVSTVALNVLGQATFTYGGVCNPVPPATPSCLALGTRVIGASYSGDTNFLNVGASPFNQVVGPANSSTVLSAQAQSSVYNQGVTYSVQVTSSGGAPTGSVDVASDGAPLKTVALDSSGHGQFTASLPTGTHVLTANYAGNATFSSSAALPIAQVVGKASTKNLITSSANPSATPQLNASVTGAYGGAVTGTVSFTDTPFPNGSATSLGSANIAGGVANFSASLTGNGIHHVVANYGGDGNYLGSSDGIWQVVSSAGAATMITLSGPNGPQKLFRMHVQNKPITINVTLSSSTPGTPTGAVYLIDDDTVLNGGNPIAMSTTGCGPAPAIACGKLDIDGLTVGEHQIVAAFAGDNTYAGAVAGPPPAPGGLDLNSAPGPH